MKTLFYETKVESTAALRRRVFVAAQHIRNHPHISSATESMLIRAKNCIATAGGHFEKVLSTRYCISVSYVYRSVALKKWFFCTLHSAHGSSDVTR